MITIILLIVCTTDDIQINKTPSPNSITVFLTANIPFFILFTITDRFAFMRVIEDRIASSGFFIISTICRIADFISS